MNCLPLPISLHFFPFSIAQARSPGVILSILPLPCPSHLIPHQILGDLPSLSTSSGCEWCPLELTANSPTPGTSFQTPTAGMVFLLFSQLLFFASQHFLSNPQTDFKIFTRTFCIRLNLNSSLSSDDLALPYLPFNLLLFHFLSLTQGPQSHWPSFNSQTLSLSPPAPQGLCSHLSKREH